MPAEHFRIKMVPELTTTMTNFLRIQSYTGSSQTFQSSVTTNDKYLNFPTFPREASIRSHTQMHKKTWVFYQYGFRSHISLLQSTNTNVEILNEIWQNIYLGFRGYLKKASCISLRWLIANIRHNQCHFNSQIRKLSVVYSHTNSRIVDFNVYVCVWVRACVRVCGGGHLLWHILTLTNVLQSTTTK
jgi:hypothetical protein